MPSAFSPLKRKFSDSSDLDDKPQAKKMKVGDVIDLTSDDIAPVDLTGDDIAPASLPPQPRMVSAVASSSSRAPAFVSSRPAPVSVPAGPSASASSTAAPAPAVSDSDDEEMPRDAVPQYTNEYRSIYEARCGCGKSWTYNTRFGLPKSAKEHVNICTRGVDPTVVPRADAASYNMLPKQGTRPDLKKIRDHFTWKFIERVQVQEKRRVR